MWRVTSDDLESIAIGAGILGTGGGGNPYLGKLRMQRLLAQGYHADVIDLDDVTDEMLVTEVGGVGAPTVGVEKLPQGDEPRWAIEALEAYIGKRIDAVISAEIGGSNSIAPLVAAALTGKLVVDGDAMGRAFPEMQMSTHFIAGVPCTPAAMVDEKGNRIIFGNVIDSFLLEKFVRDLCIPMGATSMLALPVMKGDQVRRTSVRRTLSLTKKIGDAVRKARQTKSSYVEAVLNLTGGHELFVGKLIDVQRRTVGGFARGEIVVEGMDAYRGEYLHIDIQNENLVAWRGDRDTRGEVVACVPDLICSLETESGEPITTEQLRYGLRITLLAIPCTDKFRTPDALKVVGPAAFGYPDVVYQPLPKVAGVGIE